MSGRDQAAAAGRLRPVALGALVLALMLITVADIKNYRDLEDARASEAELAAQIAETRRRIETLEERRDLLRDDPAALERLAREELRMVRPGEVVILLPPEAEAEAAAAADGERPAAASPPGGVGERER